MANYFWLGASGATGGNVNIIQNWTLFGPTASTQQNLPPHAATLPGYKDSIIFTRYTLTDGVKYPQFAPHGTMGGGGNTGQYFLNVSYKSECPVALGNTLGYFAFRAGNISLVRGITSSFNTISDNDYYIELLPGVGNTSSNCVISTNTQLNGLNYNFRGVAAAYTTAVGQDIQYGNYTFFGVTLEGTFLQGASGAFVLSRNTYQNYNFVGNCHFIDLLSSSAYSLLYIHPGLLIDQTMKLTNLNPDGAYVPSVVFTPGFDQKTTKINKFEIEGGITQSNIVAFGHPVGITYYKQRGGNVTITSDFDVLDGEVQIPFSIIGIDARYNNVIKLGSNIGFTVKNPLNVQTSPFTIVGTADFYILPLSP